METKVCKKCGKELPLTMFYTNRATKDGYTPLCKRCFRERYARPATRYGILPAYTTDELIAEVERRGYIVHTTLKKESHE